MTTRLVILLLCAFTFTALPAQEKVTRIHWVGSAWMKFHGLDRQCGGWLEMQPDFGKVRQTVDKLWPLHALLDEPPSKMQLYGDARTQPEIIAEMKAGEFDILVLSVQLEMVAKDSNAAAFTRTMDFFSGEAKRNHARLVFAAYGTKFDDTCARGMERLRPLAKQYGAVICPWWTAMKLAAAERPDAPLFDAKVKGHPGPGSTYLNLCTFLFALTNTPPEKLTLPLEYQGWDAAKPPCQLSADEARFFQQAAWKAWESVRD
ncbi:hypothetical protein [Prosthecobacter sp.]|uniref:hypothetical protein n=1 Tax=Prosthecobacter sp. TaxID=1965333 RepID=UPI0037845FA0